jgi:hypothetical protein
LLLGDGSELRAAARYGASVVLKDDTKERCLEMYEYSKMALLITAEKAEQLLLYA